MQKSWIHGLTILGTLLILAPGLGAEEPVAELGLEPAPAEKILEGPGADALTIEELGLGEPAAPQQMSCSGDFACYDDDAICGGCPPGYACGAGANPTSSPWSCCLTGPFVCVQSCRWHISSCSSFCTC